MGRVTSLGKMPPFNAAPILFGATTRKYVLELLSFASIVTALPVLIKLLSYTLGKYWFILLELS